MAYNMSSSLPEGRFSSLQVHLPQNLTKRKRNGIRPHCFRTVEATLTLKKHICKLDNKDPTYVWRCNHWRPSQTAELHSDLTRLQKMGCALTSFSHLFLSPLLSDILLSVLGTNFYSVKLRLFPPIWSFVERQSYTHSSYKSVH
jgi:hypothetical protein